LDNNFLFSDPRELFRDDIRLKCSLMGWSYMLEVATSTPQAVRVLTWRINSELGWLRYGNYICAIKGGASACDFDSALLAGNSVSHKNNSPVVTGYEMSPVRDLFNSDIDQITNF
jgi:hypothetical protein